MRGTIVETGFEAATNADLLTSTRLQTAPSDGVMLFQFQASDNNNTDRYVVNIQLPDSDVPFIDQQVPMGATGGLGGQLDERFMTQFRATVQGGGRVVFSCTESGDAEFTWRVIFTPLR